MRTFLSAFIILLVATFGFVSFGLQGKDRIVSPASSESSFEPGNISLNRIFNEDKSWIATLSAERVRTMVVTGDVIPARMVNIRTIEASDFTWAFKNVHEYLADADITFVNLETPLISGCPPKETGMIFCGDPRHIEGLKLAGVDVANLGNNHAGNYGQASVDETVGLLDSNGIVAIGANNNPQYKNVKGLIFAFLGYDDVESYPGISKAEKDEIKLEITEARRKADVVIVQYHWGVEYTQQPSDRQKELGRLAIDSGADLVIGNHPHWIQPVETYKGKLITYAHGNFVFDQMWSQKTREGVVGRYYFYNDKLVDVLYTPIVIFDYGQPNFAEGDDKKRIIDEMKLESEKLAGE